MKRTFAFIFFLCVFTTGTAQEDLSVNRYWAYNGDVSNVLYDHICRYACDQMVDYNVIKQTYRDAQNLSILCNEPDVFSKLIQWLK